MSWRRPCAFALRLHMSAAPTRVGLTQALGGRKAFGGLALQHGELAGFGWRCSSVCFLRRLLFGQVRLARSHIACVMFAGFGSAVWHRSAFQRLMLSFLTGPAESSRVRVRAFPLRLSASAPGFDAHRHPPPPNNSFKPTHSGASTACYTLRLHAVAAPLWVGLTQALGPHSCDFLLLRLCYFCSLVRSSVLIVLAFIPISRSSIARWETNARLPLSVATMSLQIAVLSVTARFPTLTTAQVISSWLAAVLATEDRPLQIPRFVVSVLPKSGLLLVRPDDRLRA